MRSSHQNRVHHGCNRRYCALHLEIYNAKGGCRATASVTRAKQRCARPIAVSSTLDVEAFPRNGLTLQPSSFFIWLILLSTVSGASGATSFVPCHKNRWSVL